MSSATSTEIAEYEYQLEQISGALEADPENDELLTLKNELQNLITISKTRLAQTTAGDVRSPASFVDQEKKRKNEAVESRSVGDQVLAKWTTGDHQFYPARITSITGSQADPVYTVKFTEYNEIQSLYSHQIRNLNEQKKRATDPKTQHSSAFPIPVPPENPSTHKKDALTQPPPPPPPSQASLLSDPSSTGTSKKKQKGSTLKEDLAMNASSWGSFAKSGPKSVKKVGKKKAIGEGSMFRTEETGRVGVIGSGRAMTGDIGKRGRHVFEGTR